MQLNKKNNIRLKIKTPITSVSTLLVVENSELLGNDFSSDEAKNFLLTLSKFSGGAPVQMEIVRVTAKRGNNLTIQRAVEACPINYNSSTMSQSAYDFDIGDIASMNLTAWDIKKITDEINKKLQTNSNADITGNWDFKKDISLDDKKIYFRARWDENHFLKFEWLFGQGDGLHIKEIWGLKFSTNQWDKLIIKPNGSIGIGVEPSHNLDNGKSLAIWDSDTWFRQNGDGVLQVYANNNKVAEFRANSIWFQKPMNHEAAQGNRADSLVRKDYVDGNFRKVAWKSGVVDNYNSRQEYTHNLNISQDDFYSGRYSYYVYVKDRDVLRCYNGTTQNHSEVFWSNDYRYDDTISVQPNIIKFHKGSWLLKQIIIYKNY